MLLFVEQQQADRFRMVGLKTAMNQTFRNVFLVLQLFLEAARWI